MRPLLLLPLLLLPACHRQDGEKLVRIGQITTEKVREAAPSRTPFGDIAPEATRLGRVRARLKGDVCFEKCPVQVTEDDDGIRLRGTVPTREHADRAEQLARQTVGVTQVVNELTVREP